MVRDRIPPLSTGAHPIVYRGREQIGTAAGIPWKQVSKFVEDHGLPAFQIGGSHIWVAMHDDLVEWVKAQRDRYLKR